MLLTDQLLVRHSTIVTMDSSRRIIRDGAVAIEDDKIVAVGETDQVQKNFKRAIIIEGKGTATLPGLVSLHFHSDNLSRGVGEHMGLEEWLDRIYYPMLAAMTPDDAYSAASLAYAEALKSGTTCVNDMYRHLGACAKAAQDIGIRAVLSSEAADLIPGQESLEDNEKAFKEWDGAVQGRIRIWFGAEWIPVCSPEFMRKLRRLADSYKTGIHVHLSESRGEVEACLKQFGKRPTEHLYDLGVLGPDVVAAHCVWMSDKDISLLKETGTHVAHAPVSNMKLGNGVARIPEMISAGINVGLGPDDAPCNNTVDMFEVMKFASLVQKATKLDASQMPSHQILEMATLNGAKALRMEKQIGSIEPRKKADLILVNLRTPRLTPVLFGTYSNLLPHLVYAAHGDDIDTVIVDGRVVVEHRQLKTLNEAEVIERATRASESLIQRSAKL